MSLLADLVWSGDVPQAGLEPLVKAIDLHQIGAADEAIEQYSAALKAGLNHPALNFNLGLLYIYSGKIEQSIPMLSAATSSPEYGAAANLMLGQGYYARKDLAKSSEYLVEALHLSDAQLNNQCDSGGYIRFASSLTEQPPEYLNDLSRVLIQYLDDNRWKDKLRDTLTGYAAQGKTSYVPDLIELVMEGGRAGMAAIMERIDTYVARHMMRMALEEIHYAIEKSPDYLPAHRRLADILVEEGKTQEAAEKINLVANVYLVRGNADKAADLFAEVIRLWPADVGARQKVIDMLKSQGRINEAVKQYAEMGDFYAKLMADVARATEIYKEALAYAKRNNAEAPGLVSILKSLADIESQQLNWRDALIYYQQVNQLAPDDQEAALATIDLNFQMGQSTQAVEALDNYIRYCITRGDAEKAVKTLEEQTRRYPNEVAVRQRLADVYRQQKRIPDAIAQMDAIGELLLDAGRVDEAAAVISNIIDLNPPDLDGYKQLLQQLKSPGA
jgi:tetratricopeptide (TPR) repeat protein